MVCAWLAVVLFGLAAEDPPSQQEALRKIAQERGWAVHYAQGNRLIRDLTSGGIAQERAEKTAVGMRIAVLGKAPGHPGLYQIDKNLSAELVDKNGKPFDPHKGLGANVTWTYLLCGTIKKVSLEDKTIVLEVLKGDWEFLTST